MSASTNTMPSDGDAGAGDRSSPVPPGTPRTVLRTSKIEPQFVNTLDIESLPAGPSHLWLSMTTDAMGAAVSIPIIVLKGSLEGPTLGLTAAVHGNELSGIPCVHRLIREIDPAQLQGTIVACPVSNVPGFYARQREFSDGKDLNRIFPGDAVSRSGMYASAFLNKVISNLTHLCDMHTASAGKVNTLYVKADMSDPIVAKMALCHQPRVVVNSAGTSFDGSSGTLRNAATKLGVKAVTVEIGNPDSLNMQLVEEALKGLRTLVAEMGMVAAPILTSEVEDFGSIREPVVCIKSGWLRSSTGGLLHVVPTLLDNVTKGQIVATQCNVFGEVVKEYKAPFSGVVIGKSLSPICETGDRIVHIGVRTTLDDLGLDEEDLNELDLVDFD